MFKNKKVEKVLINVIYFLLGTLIPTFILLIVINFNRNHPKIVYYDFNDTIHEESKNEWKYKMIPQDWSDYIVDMCNEVGIDSDLIVSLILKENPECNPDAIHKNDNGTIDMGVGQLNDRYFYTTFVPRYWHFDFECNPFNWKMNIYIMIHHVKYLQDTLKVQEYVVKAYNCGEYAVMNNNVPDSTNLYCKIVMTTYNMFKEINVDR